MAAVAEKIEKMPVEDALPPYLGDSILTLAATDDDAANVICNTLSPDHFDSIFHRKIAQRVFDYVDRFKSAPAVHLDEILDDLAFGKDEKKSGPYKRILEGIIDSQDLVNKQYVMDSIAKFVRQQTLKSGVMASAKLIKDGKVEQAEAAMNKALRARQTTFDGGMTFYSKNTLSFLEQEDNWIRMGIPELDNRGICPAPRELFTVMAPSGRGKTWMMIHLAKMALMQGKRVLHISLEMSEEKCMQRYVQSFYSISKRPLDSVKVCEFETNDDGSLSDLVLEDVDAKLDFTNPDIYDILNKKMRRGKHAKQLGGRKYPLKIKQFPTNQLTIRELNAYLDSLERHENWTPDLLVLDYADLMKIDAANQRIETGKIYQDIRGIGVERNFAVVTASQSNRSGEDAKVIDLRHLAEDYSKAAISDNIITYNQTDAERAFGLARLYVAKGRNDEAFIQVAIAQAYGIGQFCLSSHRVDHDTYWETVEEGVGDD